jgi:RimJ/RimL family protein N-acetyltransferase
VLGAEAARLRALRLASLAADAVAFGSTYARDAARPAQWWQRWAAQSEDGSGQRTFVLVDEHDRWLGLALVRREQQQPGTAVVLAMWVAPGVRGRGGAYALCDACAIWAKAQGLHELRLEVVVENATARRAYQAAGFEVRGESEWSQAERTLQVLIMTRPV